jgi:hypothetical protein
MAKEELKWQNIDADPTPSFDFKRTSSPRWPDRGRAG